MRKRQPDEADSFEKVVCPAGTTFRLCDLDCDKGGFRQRQTSGAAAELFREARTVLAGSDKLHPKLNRQKARTLHDRLREFQNEYQNQRWGPARIVHNWDLMLVEHGLAICLWHLDSPADGYKLAADYCQNYDSHYGNGLNGPSRKKIKEIVRFMFTIEALEDGPK
jgi:hypothetical protein